MVETSSSWTSLAVVVEIASRLQPLGWCWEKKECAVDEISRACFHIKHVYVKREACGQTLQRCKCRALLEQQKSRGGKKKSEVCYFMELL